MSTKRLKELISKKKSGEISLSEQRELLSLVKSSITNETIYNATEDFFDTPLSFEHVIDSHEVEAAVAKLNHKLEQHHKQTAKKRILPWIKISTIAASFILFIGISFLFSDRSKPAYNSTKNIVATKKGSKSNITLPDGSRVWINGDTKITYDKAFGDGNRDVYLIGEAYFDVVKNTALPFIVHTKTIDVKVFGTAFNVRAYTNESNTQTTLLRGSVEILLKNKQRRSFMLKPNEKIIVQNNFESPSSILKDNRNIPEILVSGIHLSPADSSAIETQWTKNRLAFEGDKLEDVAKVLERWYNVKVIITDKILYNKKVSGVFEDRSLNNIMEALGLATGFKYIINENNNTITISLN